MAVSQHILKLINQCFDAEFGIQVCLNLCELEGLKITRAVVETVYTERELELI